MKKIYLSIVKTWTLAAGLVLLGVAIGQGLNQPAAAPVHTLAGSVPAGSASFQHPLTIVAQRARPYLGGSFRVETDLGTGEGYRLSQVSYNSDGLRVQALMATPDSARPLLGYPVIILAHGYVSPVAYRTNGPEYQDTIRAFARAGYVVIKPDFRGYGGSWGSPSSAYYDTGDTADILNLANSLAAYPIVDAGNVGLWGHSMGGHVVLSALTVAPQRFKAAVIASAGIGTLSDMYATWHPQSDDENPVGAIARNRLVQLFGTPRANPAFWDSVSPLSYAKEIATPLQLHTGLLDRVVPPRFTDQASGILTAAGHAPALYHYLSGGHSYGGEDLRLLQSRSLELFNAHLRRY